MLNVREFDQKNIEDILFLTPMQEGMLYYYLRNPGSDDYFEQLCLSISGTIDLELFEKAWNAVIDANQMLRVVFRWEGIKKPVQIVLKKYALKYRYFDLSTSGGGQRKKPGSGKGRLDGEAEEQMETIKTRDRKNNFDLRQVPFRVILCKVGDDRFKMIISHHHILYDGWSSGIILKEFLNAYHSLERGEEPARSIKTGFKEYVKYIDKQEKRRQHAFWNEYLGGARDVRESPRGKKRPRQINNVTEKGNFTVRSTGETVRKLDSFIKDRRVTPASIIYTAWGLLLNIYNDRNDIIFDTTVSGRSVRLEGIEEMVGLFINTLPLLVDARPGEKIADCLYRINKHLHAREVHEHTSTVVIDKCLEGIRDLLPFNSVVVFENYPLDRILFSPGEKFRIDSYSIIEKTRHDLTVLIKLSGTLDISLTFNEDLFNRSGVETLAELWLNIVAEMLGGPENKIGELTIFKEKDRHKIIKSLIRKRGDFNKSAKVKRIAPRNEVERRLSRMWSEILRIGQPEIDIDTDFFDYGGHSLRVSLLISDIHRTFNVKLPVAEVFNRKTIRELAKYITGRSRDYYETLKSSEEREYYVAASNQERFYMLQQLEPGNTAYNVTSVVKIEGKLDEGRLERTFGELVERHESLRTSFLQVDGKPVQRVHRTVDFKIEYYSGEGLSEEILPTEIIRGIVKPFELNKAPLWRSAIIRVGETLHIWVVDMHHIITDGVSMNIFIEDFSALYRDESLSPLTLQYKDFSVWQARQLMSGALEKEEKFWLQRLSGQLPVLNMPTDWRRPKIRGFAGDRIYFQFEGQAAGRLQTLLKETETTLFIFLLAAFSVLLHSYTGQEDLIIGTTVAGRNHPDVNRVFGIFIETLVLRNYPRPHISFNQFLQEVKKNTLAAFENQSYPFKEVTKRLEKDGINDLSANPLFDIMLIVQNVEETSFDIPGLNIIPVNYFSRVSKVDLTLEAVQIGEGIHFHIEYCTRLFKRETVERLAGHFKNILGELTRNPGIDLANLVVLDREERRKILDEFSTAKEHAAPSDGRSLPKEMVYDLFSKQVAKTPDNIAVNYEDSEAAYNLQVTYKELDRQVTLLSGLLEEL